MRTHTDLELFAEKCWATDSEDRNGKPMKELITNGCEMEKSLTIMDAVTPIKTRFFFDAFRFHSDVCFYYLRNMFGYTFKERYLNFSFR